MEYRLVAVVMYFTCLATPKLFAQQDTTFNLLRNNVNASFNFQVVESANGEKRYAAPKDEVQRLFGLLANFVALESDYDSLNVIRTINDSLMASQQITYLHAIQLGDERVENLKNANDKLVAINNQLNATLDKCIAIKHHTARRTTRSILFAGLLCLPIGFMIGSLSN